MDLHGCRKKVDRMKLARQSALSNVEREVKFLESISGKTSDVESAQSIVQGIAQAVQQKVQEKISAVVSRCLEAVFGDDAYEFAIRFDQKRGKTEARIVFVRDGKEFDDPLNEVGGGVLDVASLALRLACIIMSKPAVRKLLILDEPFSAVRGVKYRNRTRKMLERLSEEMGIQWIISTDVEAFRLGTVVDFNE